MVKKYNQIYDILKTLKFDDYINDKRNIIHQQLFNEALDKFIKQVNKAVHTYMYYPTIEKPNGEKIMDGVKYAEMLAEIPDVVINHFALMLFDHDIEQIDKSHFKIIEIKNKIWYMPSYVLFIYTGKNKHTGKIEKIKFGPYILLNCWNSLYLTNRKDINELMLGDIYVELEIIYIDYVKGSITIYDRGENRTFVVDIDYINSDIKISKEYDGKMYSILKNNSL